MKFVVIGLIFFSAIGALLYIGIVEGSIPNYKIPELVSGSYQGGECRVDGGKLLQIEQAANPLRFTVMASDGSKAVLKVETPRLPPDNFKLDIPVGLRGVYHRDRGVFVASDVTTACPTKYAGTESKAGSQEGGKPGSGTPAAGTPPLPPLEPPPQAPPGKPLNP